MSQNQLNLADLFQAVTQSLAENQQALDQADEYNHDHGTNMVGTFDTITQSLRKKKRSSDSAALNYAARQLKENSTSGSGQLYAEQLAKAAKQLRKKKVKRVNSTEAVQLLQTMIDSEPAAKPARQSGAGDRGGLTIRPAGGGTTIRKPAQSSGEKPLTIRPAGGGTPQPQAQPSSSPMSDIMQGFSSSSEGTPSPQYPQPGGGADLISMLMEGLAAGGGASAQGSGSSADLISMLMEGMAAGDGASAPQYPQSSGGEAPAQGSGGSDLISMLLPALLGGGGSSSSQSGSGSLIGTLLGGLAQAFLGGSSLGRSAAHRSQSTEVVVNSFLQELLSESRK